MQEKLIVYLPNSETPFVIKLKEGENAPAVFLSWMKGAWPFKCSMEECRIYKKVSGCRKMAKFF